MTQVVPVSASTTTTLQAPANIQSVLPPVVVLSTEVIPSLGVSTVVSQTIPHITTLVAPQVKLEEEMAYAKRTDFVADDLIYRGEAAPGTPEASPRWRIRRLTIGVDGDVTEEWAAGNAEFTQVWADHLTLTYL